jgi:hypothetical protein
MSTNEKGFWSGVAEVVPHAGSDMLGGADGAYVGVVGLADSQDVFLERVRSALSAMEFDVMDLADVEFIESPEHWTESDEVMRDRAASLNRQNMVECGTFHCFTGSENGGQSELPRIP